MKTLASKILAASLVFHLAIHVSPSHAQPIAQQAYLKASNTGSDDIFGLSVAASGDTVVVGAFGEDSNSTGVNGSETNNSALDSGAVYVFVRNGSNWTQQAYLKASNTGGGDSFGTSVALDGDTLVVGAPSEASNATGVNGNQSNNSAFFAGAAYVFVRSGTNWTQQAYLKASNTGQQDTFGSSVAVSGDTVLVGSPQEASNATGVNGNQSDNSAAASGAAYVFVRNETNWTQQANLKASNAGAAYVFTGVGPQPPPELRLTAARNGNMLQLTATGTTNTQWRIESRNSLTDTNPWQPLTNITLGSDAFILDEPLTATSGFFRSVWLP